MGFRLPGVPRTLLSRPERSSLAVRWELDPAVVFLNHGSFGACPTEVLEAQEAWRHRLEREPVRFMVRELEGLIDQARESLAAFVHADPASLVFVPNATAGVNAVLRSLSLRPGDELVTTSHEYNASRNALEFVAARAGARVVTAEIPFPIASPEDVVERVLAMVGPSTRLVLIDHITSQTALVFPLRQIVSELNTRGIDTLVDGAHGPGMVPLDLQSLGASWYTGNCHKWICAPKGAGFLVAREDRREEVRPVAISHGANSPRNDRSRYQLEFDWTGTFDPTPWLCVPVATEVMAAMVPGGWSEIMRRNRDLVLRGRALLCETLGIEPPAPEKMIGSIAAVPLPAGRGDTAPSLYGDPLQDVLLEELGIEVPVVPWPQPPHRVLRISAQLYNHIDQYRFLAEGLTEMLEREKTR